MTGTEELNSELGTADVIWNLGDLYASPESTEFITDSKWCEQEAKIIGATFHGAVAGLSAGRLAELVRRLEILDTRLGKLATFAFLNFTTRIDNEAAGALYQKIQELASRCDKETVFFALEWNTIEDETADSLLGDHQLADYRHYLRILRRYRPHQLEEIEERLLIETKTVGRSSWKTLFEKVIGNLRFGAAERTEEEVLSDLYHPDRQVRETAAGELTAGLKSQNHILTHIYNTLAADKMISDRLRKHRQWVSSMNLDNQIAGRDGRYADRCSNRQIRYRRTLLQAQGATPRAGQTLRLRPLRPASGTAETVNQLAALLRDGARRVLRVFRAVRAHRRTIFYQVLDPCTTACR